MFVSYVSAYEYYSSHLAILLYPRVCITCNGFIASVSFVTSMFNQPVSIF
jgi:predicted solute-binding protein